MARLLVHIYGIAFLLLGGLGFGFHGPRNETVMVFGLLPVNALLRLVHLVVGGSGVFSGVLGGSAPRVYGRVVGVCFLVLALLEPLPSSDEGIGTTTQTAIDRWMIRCN